MAQVMNNKKHMALVSYCESFLEKYGDNYLGVGWTKKQEDADTRYRVMLEVIRPETLDRIRLLDFGCGASHLYEYILKHKLTQIEYSGLDLSDRFLELSKTKFPDIPYYQVDLLDDPINLPAFDYIILNGIFNSKCDLSYDEMLSYFQAVVGRVFERARVGIALNVMSKHVDWERDDLFHLPFDVLASFLTKNISRHFVIRSDYGLYEYTAYVYKHASSMESNNRGDSH